MRLGEIKRKRGPAVCAQAKQSLLAQTRGRKKRKKRKKRWAQSRCKCCMRVWPATSYHYLPLCFTHKHHAYAAGIFVHALNTLIHHTTPSFHPCPTGSHTNSDASHLPSPRACATMGRCQLHPKPTTTSPRRRTAHSFVVQKLLHGTDWGHAPAFDSECGHYCAY